MDGQQVGWVFLPGEGTRMHRTEVGRTLCGRDLDPTVVILQHPRRAFSICVACRDAGAPYPIPAPAPAGARPQPWQRVVDGPRLGWVQLPKPALRVLHRPDPYIPDRVLCGLKLPGRVPIHETPPCDWARCDSCQAKIDADPDEARRDGPRPTPRADAARRAGQRQQQRQPKPLVVSARIRDRLAAGPVLGGGPVGAAGTWRLPVGWVRLKDQAVWHRPHPERPKQVMCELPLPAATPVYQRRVTTKAVCPDCQAVHTQALKELRALDRQLPPPLRRAVPRELPRAQIVRGGLPTLGRDR